MFPPPFQPNSASGLWYFVFAINLICLTISQSQGTLCSRRKKCYQMYRQSFSTRAYTRSNLKITALRLDPRTYLLNWNGILEGLRWFVFSQKSQLLFAFSVTKIFFFLIVTCKLQITSAFSASAEIVGTLRLYLFGLLFHFCSKCWYATPNVYHSGPKHSSICNQCTYRSYLHTTNCNRQ